MNSLALHHPSKSSTNTPHYYFSAWNSVQQARFLIFEEGQFLLWFYNHLTVWEIPCPCLFRWKRWELYCQRTKLPLLPSLFLCLHTVFCISKKSSSFYHCCTDSSVSKLADRVEREFIRMKCMSGCGKPHLLWVGSSHHSDNDMHTTLPARLTISQCDIALLFWRMGILPTWTLVFALRPCLTHEHTLRSVVGRSGGKTGSICLFLWWFSLYVACWCCVYELSRGT